MRRRSVCDGRAVFVRGDACVRCTGRNFLYIFLQYRHRHTVPRDNAKTEGKNDVCVCVFGNKFVSFFFFAYIFLFFFFYRPYKNKNWRKDSTGRGPKLISRRRDRQYYYYYYYLYRAFRNVLRFRWFVVIRRTQFADIEPCKRIKRRTFSFRYSFQDVSICVGQWRVYDDGQTMGGPRFKLNGPHAHSARTDRSVSVRYNNY